MIDEIWGFHDVWVIGVGWDIWMMYIIGMSCYDLSMRRIDDSTKILKTLGRLACGRACGLLICVLSRCGQGFGSLFQFFKSPIL